MTDEHATDLRTGGEERLEEVDEKIRQARDQAEEVLGEPDREFHESGATPQEDDQTIAPPG